ncbi:hypothetical protein K7X08_029983 [Anisodus acutangulus]|uniref:AAA+ ATPase domain-containing protein n=1 Tax=Anisodus acutangulus TaxID=402998 RepID=A0A9Q1LJW2_9SOLA|nr:hypothetical protein K7X08_029983 [Anisodus acutangulus]
MDILCNVVSGFVVEVGKFVCRYIYPKIENTVHFSSKIEKLRTDLEVLTKLRDDIKGRWKELREKAINQNQMLSSGSTNEWKSMQERIAAAKRLAYKCVGLHLEVSIQAQNKRDQLCRLKEVGESFGSNLVVENSQVKKVEPIPVTSIESQSAATKNLNKILQLLEDDRYCWNYVFIIGVWGAGGVGKSTLVKNLNNELLKTAASSSKLSLGVVVWVEVPKSPIDIRKVQARIAKRLKLEVDNEESAVSSASKICERLKQERSFLLILDDVWEAIDLNDVGVPQPEAPARSKVVITSRSLEVCRKIKTDTEMNVSTLDEDVSWQLFALRVLNLCETGIRELPSSINSLYQLRALILQGCRWLKELPPIGDLCNLQVLDCAYTRLRCLPQGMDKLSSIEMINMLHNLITDPVLDELSSLQKLTSRSGLKEKRKELPAPERHRVSS